MDDKLKVQLHGGPLDGSVAYVSADIMGYASVKVPEGLAVYEATAETSVSGLQFIGTVDTE